MPESAEHGEDRGSLPLLQQESIPRCCAVLCGEAVIDSTGKKASLLKTHISTIWYKDPRSVHTSYLKIWSAVSVQTDCTCPLNVIYMYYLFMHALSQPSCWPLNYQTLDHFIWTHSADTEDMIWNHITWLALCSTQYNEDVYQGHSLPIARLAFIHSIPTFHFAVKMQTWVYLLI